MRRFSYFVPGLLFLTATTATAPALAAPATPPAIKQPTPHAVKTPGSLSHPASTRPTPGKGSSLNDLDVISSGAKVKLTDYLTPEHPTVFIFFKPNSTLERDFVKQLQPYVEASIGFCAIELKTGQEPVAQQYKIQETPTAIVYDRRARVVGRSSRAVDIQATVRQAAQVMRIDWAEEGDPRLDAARQMLGGQKNLPSILRTMTLQPDYLQGFMALSMKAQFSDGFLDRRTKEMIGTYASALNQCPYCLGSHASNLERQGEDPLDVDAIAMLHPQQAKITPKEQVLLDYVKILTQTPSQVRDTNVERLRRVGWTDEQIFEASYITSLFAFANRMASAYDLGYPNGGWLPPTLRVNAPVSTVPAPAAHP